MHGLCLETGVTSFVATSRLLLVLEVSCMPSAVLDVPAKAAWAVSF